MVNMKEETKKIGIGIIGCGSRIKDILNLSNRFFELCKIIAIYDINKSATEDYLRSFGNDIRVYNNYNDLLTDKSIEWIFIGSINYAHKDQLIASFNSGKHVFCEKPLAITIEECEEIKKVFDSKNLNFFIGYVLRHSPHYKKIKEIIDSGKIGKIISMEFNETIPFNHGSFFMGHWRRFTEYSGGFLLEKCCHDIDLANWITESIPRKLASFGGLDFFKSENSNFFEEIIEKQGDIMFDGKNVPNPFITEKDIIDNQVAIIEYYNGIKATFHTNLNSSIPERRMYICGTKGTLRADVHRGIIEVNSINSPKEKIEIIKTKNNDSHGGGDLFFIKDLERAMLSKTLSNNLMDEAIISAISTISIENARKENKIIEMGPIWKNLGFNNFMN